MSVVITGGTGYLGQFLVQHFVNQGCKVAYTYNAANPLTFCPTALACKVDLATGDGLTDCLQQAAPVALVVNCAAISQPGVCEKDPELARAVNVPKALVACVEQVAATASPPPLLVHISTDQVYDGSKAWWKEGDPTEPVNAYGRTKLEAEEFILANYPHSVMLRSSIIYGPQSPQPVPRSLFLQFVDAAFSKEEPTSFFNDEYRCPTYVSDICAIVGRLLQLQQQQQQQQVAAAGWPLPDRVFNMGGPERLSRVDMAVKVAEARGYDKSKIQSVPRASVNRAVRSPPDISMDVSRLTKGLGLQLTPFSDALAQIFALPSSSSTS